MKEAPGEFSGTGPAAPTAEGYRPGAAVVVPGRAGADAGGAGQRQDRRRNMRWERLGEVLRELDELREAWRGLLGRPHRRAARAVQPPRSRAVAIP